jgi:hypothetical protein
VATYVKVFARRAGSRAAVFHKDGCVLTQWCIIATCRRHLSLRVLRLHDVIRLTAHGCPPCRYTDVRGMFDYVSTTGGRASAAAGAIERFAILITHQHWGAVIEEAQPPHTLH